MINSNKIKNIVLTALFASIIYVSVAFLFHIPTGLNNGYIHLGDAFIYLGAAILPMPFNMIAAGIGAGLADVLSGSAIWLIPTLIIKSIIALSFTSKGDKILCKKNIIAVFISGFIGISGYYIAELILLGNFLAPIAGVLPNLVQAIGSGLIFVLIAISLDKLNLKKKI